MSRSRHEPEYNVLNKIVIEKATYAYLCVFDTKTLDKEAGQVRSTWSRYRGGRGMYIGVMGRMCAGDSRDIITLFMTNYYYISTAAFYRIAYRKG